MITGERVTTANGGLHPTFQRHVAAYRLCAPLLPEGRETVRAEMRALPFADGSFQSVISVQSIEHVPDAGLGLAEVVRVQGQRLYDRRLRNARAEPRGGALEVGPEAFWRSEQRPALAVDLVAICDRD